MASKRKMGRPVHLRDRFPDPEYDFYNERLKADILEAHILGTDPNFFPSDLDIEYTSPGLPEKPEDPGR